ncbi:MAG: zf-HC2 domain-containing protein, partial [Myxococcales bacterium]|nr:zf-HC2 domain-containing protein [Myxococcales bacterium]
MSATCVSEPVSWLRLERYALGELPGPLAREVAAHLAGCPACRACLDRIE